MPLRVPDEENQQDQHLMTYEDWLAEYQADQHWQVLCEWQEETQAIVDDLLVQLNEGTMDEK